MDTPIPQEPLCYRCVVELNLPATLAVVGGREVHAGGRTIAETVREVLQLSDGDPVVTINSLDGCRIYADLLYHGSTVCMGHLPMVIHAHMSNPRSIPWPG